MLLDEGRLQDGEPHLAGTARKPVVRLSADTAAEIGAADGDEVTVSTPRGSITLPLNITDMPDRVVWLPLNSPGSAVHRQLGTALGSLVKIGARDRSRRMTAFGHDPWWLVLGKALAIFVFLMLNVLVAILIERKILGWMQLRPGPNRAGPWGALQSLADGIKLALKESITPKGVDWFVYMAAPVISTIPAFTAFAFIPFGPEVSVFGHRTPLQLTDLPVAVLFILGFSAIGVYGIVLGGWASGSTYPLLGGVRSTAQVISYEVAMGLSFAAVFLYAGTMSTSEIVAAQDRVWYVFLLLPSFIIYLISMVGETNRAPFDLPEAEGELVAGFHTEYSSLKFAMFMLAEYVNMITVSSLATAMFFGGWHAPWPINMWAGANTGWWPVLWFTAKMWVFLFIYMWLRASLPRLRYDQFMALGWKLLIPASLVWVVIAAAIRTLRNEGNQHWTPILVVSSVVFAVALVLLLRKPISAPSNRDVERALRRQRNKAPPRSIPDRPSRLPRCRKALQAQSRLRARRTHVAKFLDGRRRIRRDVLGDVQKARHRGVSGEARSGQAPRYHGRHQLNRYPDGLEKCIGCELCAWACPADAIYVEGADNTDEARFSPGERYGRVYQINYLRCIGCGLCIEACPTRALTMTNEYEMADDNRADLIYEKDRLLAPLLQDMLAPPHPRAEGATDKDYYQGNVTADGLRVKQNAKSGDVTGDHPMIVANLAAEAIVRTSTGEAVTFWVLGALARDRRARGGAGRQRGVLGDVPGDDDDHPGGVLHGPGRAVLGCRSGRGLHRRGDDAVLVRADADRRGLGGITEGDAARTAGRRGDHRCRVRHSADRRHRQRGAPASFAGLTAANANGNVEGLAALIFSRYLWAFELTSALLITAAVGAMVLAHRERFERRKTQRELSEERFLPGGHPTPMPSPGVYARHNAVDMAAMLPDGSYSELSVSRILRSRGCRRQATRLPARPPSAR